MDRIASLVRPIVNKKYIAFPQTFQGEVIRKALHLLIALVPLLAGIDLRATMMLLAGGTRPQGVPTPMCSVRDTGWYCVSTRIL